MTTAGSRSKRFLAELRRRKVHRVALAYLSAGAALALATAQLWEVLGLPLWSTRLVILLVVAGLPVALTLAWTYEVRPEAPAPAPGDGASSSDHPPGGPAPVAGWQEFQHDVTEHEVVLTAEVCRRLDRNELDARLIGDTLQYSDNHAESDVLVCYLHGFGGDHQMWEQMLRRSRYRSVAPTLYGFEPGRTTPPKALSLRDHGILFRHFVGEIVREAQPEVVLLVGFSSGADFTLRLVADRPAGEPPPADGLLALGANLTRATCFVSGALAKQDSAAGADLLPELRKAGAGATGLAEWLDLHEYLVAALRKFHGDLTPLSRHGQDIVRPFLEADDAFARWYREASTRVRALCCVFADTAMESEPAQRLLLDHLDSGVLGPRFREGSIVIEPGSHHFDLKRPEVVQRHLARLLEAMGHPVPVPGRSSV